jgi:hypothetical protein
MFKGETTSTVGSNRFSIDFAGRAVDIIAQYDGPI